MEKILRKQLDVTVEKTDRKPELVFDGRGNVIFLYIEINGKGYGGRHLRTRHPLKKAMERFSVLFRNLTMGRLDLNEENITKAISLCIETYEHGELMQDLRTSLRLSFAALILAVAALVWAAIQ